MARITVIGGTGYAGSAIVREAVTRGHEVTALSRMRPALPTAGVTYVEGDVCDEAILSLAIDDADVVVAALAPRRAMAAKFRDINRMIAELSAAVPARLVVVGGYSSLRPAPGADRFVADPTHIPAAVRDEVLAGAAVIMEDLPAAPSSLDWVFVSPALGFGAHAPSEVLGRYSLGDDVAVYPDTGGVISAADYALGLVDLIERDEHHQTQVNLGNPGG